MYKTVLIMEYDGTQYHGSQLQADLPTIQGEAEKALYQLMREWTRVVTASRTDAGVHAKGQVASFKTRSRLPLRAVVNGLNHYLPGDIAVKAAYRVRDSVNVRRDATSREYRYHIVNSSTRSPMRRDYAYQVKGDLHIEAMNKACQTLIGVHDFASFASRMEADTKHTVRNVLTAKLERVEEMVLFDMTANSFLPHQVRNTVGSLIRVGLGKISPDDFYTIIEARKVGLAGPTAPACGLCLMRVNYPYSFGEICHENLYN